MKRVPTSVVIPCFNCAADLNRSLASVLRQSALPAEVILVDDSSVDGGETRATIENLIALQHSADGPKLSALFLEQNVGPGGARNAGWDLATTDYIAFLDADDAWHPRKLEIQYEWMEQHPDYVGSGHRTVLMSDPNAGIGISLPIEAQDITLKSALFSNSLQTRTMILRRDIPNRFPYGLRYAEDYALWLDLLAGNHRLALLDAPLAFSFRPEFSPGGQSARLWQMERAELFIYRQLAREGKIALPLAGAASTFSLAKFFRRGVVRWSGNQQRFPFPPFGDAKS